MLRAIRSAALSTGASLRCKTSSFKATRSFASRPDHMGTYDHYQQDEIDRIKTGDPNKLNFAYFMLGGSRFIYASAGRLAVLKLLDTMNASADVLALASLEVDIGAVETGTAITVKWRGKPVFVRRRTPDEIAQAENVDIGSLRDQQTDAERVQNPEWLVLLGICTHLGCVPLNGAGDYKGWFCPCHGSHYDTSGRIRKGPAPLNLEIPPYKFLEPTKLLIG